MSSVDNKNNISRKHVAKYHYLRKKHIVIALRKADKAGRL